MADVKISALTEETTPAAGMMFPIVSGAATKKIDLFKVQPIYLTPEMFGAIGDGSTNDATALQNMFNYQRDNGGVIVMKNKTYRSNSALTHQRNTTGGPEHWVIYTNGAIISFASSGLTSGSLFTLGATSQNNGHDTGHILVYGSLNIIGPETANFWEGGEAAGTTIGIDLQYAFNIIIDNPHPKNCYIGMRTKNTYPGVMRLLETSNNGVGLMCEDNSTLMKWEMPTFRSCRYGWVCRPNTTSGVVLNQVADSPRFEQCRVGFVADSRDGSGFGIQGIFLDNSYIEQIQYDFQRWGTAWTWANPQTVGANNTRDIYNCKSHSGAWSGTTWTSTHHPLVLDTAGQCRGCDFIIQAEIDEVSGSYANSSIRTLYDTTLGSVSTQFYYSNAVIGGLRTSFSAYHGGLSDATGDNTLATLIFATEDYDAKSDYNDGNGTFTARTTGIHLLTTTVGLGGILNTHDRGLLQIVVSGTSAKEAQLKFNPYLLADSAGDAGVSLTHPFYMTAGDTAVVKVRCTGGTKVVDIVSSSYTMFAGYFVG